MMDIAVLVEHAEVAGVGTATGEGFLCGLLVVQDSPSSDIAAEHHFADGLAVARHGLHVSGG